MFWFDLAALWGCPVWEAKQRCDSREFVSWQAYYQLNPWGEWRADWRAGMLAATMANIHRGKNTQAYKPGDFMPKFGPAAKPRRQTVEEQKAVWASILKAEGGLLRSKKPSQKPT